MVYPIRRNVFRAYIHTPFREAFCRNHPLANLCHFLDKMDLHRLRYDCGSYLDFTDHTHSRQWRVRFQSKLLVGFFHTPEAAFAYGYLHMKTDTCQAAL